MLRVAAMILIAGCAGSPPPVIAPTETAQIEAAPEIVAVNWLGRGRRYAARVVERRHGLTGVEYADGERDWVDAERLGPLPDLSGRAVEIYVRRSAQPATVIEARESLFHVRLADGADTWIDASVLYAIEPAAPPPQQQQEQRPAPVFARRRPVDPTSVTPGARVLAYWVSGEAPQLNQPWICQVRAVHGAEADLLFSDGSEATVPLDYVLRVFTRRAGRARAGDRVWVRNGNVVGYVFDRAGRLVKIGFNAEEQSWMESSEVISRVTPIDQGRVVEGANVTAVWGSGSPYHATVVSRQGDQVTLQWHDGSSPGTVSIDDVIEVWEAI